MSIGIEKIFLSSHFKPNRQKNEEHTNTDVIVYLTDGKKYVASFTTFLKVGKQQLEHMQNGEFLNGKFFWEKNMILIDNCEEANIKLVVEYLLEEGDFLNVFEKI